MNSTKNTYANGQKMSKQTGSVLTYYFENGDIKAEGKYLNGTMQGEWHFNKKEGYLWQVGHFDEDGLQHGNWVRYNADGSPQQEKRFDHGKQQKV